MLSMYGTCTSGTGIYAKSMMFVCCLQLLSASLDGHLAVWDCSDGALLRVRDG